jgi:hypothetical protein
MTNYEDCAPEGALYPIGYFLNAFALGEVLS